MGGWWSVSSLLRVLRADSVLMELYIDSVRSRFNLDMMSATLVWLKSRTLVAVSGFCVVFPTVGFPVTTTPHAQWRHLFAGRKSARGIEQVVPALVFEHVLLSHAVIHVAPTPATDHVAPVPVTDHAAPAYPMTFGVLSEAGERVALTTALNYPKPTQRDVGAQCAQRRHAARIGSSSWHAVSLRPP